MSAYQTSTLIQRIGAIRSLGRPRLGAELGGLRPKHEVPPSVP